MTDAIAKEPVVPESGRQSRRARLWQALNAPFVLFLLSSVVLGAATLAYESYTARAKMQREQALRTSRLLSEAEYRLGLIERMLKPEFTYTQMYSAEAALIGIEGNRDSDGDRIGSYSPLWPEFAQRSLASLIYEISEEAGGANRLTPEEGAMSASEALSAAVDDDVVLIRPVSPGASDSIWTVRRQRRQQLADHLQLIRKVISEAKKEVE